MFIEPNYRPKVLLLGNGINNWSEYHSWTDLLIDLCDDPKIKEYLQNDSQKKTLPMSMQAVLATGDDILGAIKRYNTGQKYKKVNPFYGRITSEKQVHALQRLLEAGFDCILTTNYSYELEFAAKQIESVTSDYQIKTLADSFVKPIENKYLVRSFNRVEFNGKENRIFHIHGEARKPNSIVLGHDYYARLLSKLIQESNSKGNQYLNNQRKNTNQTIDSWIDLFLLGDVYILGFGFDFAEVDLWWLLNRKKNEKADHGDVIFYDIWEDKINERNMMLELMNVKTENFGIYRKNGTIKEFGSVRVEDAVGQTYGYHGQSGKKI